MTRDSTKTFSLALVRGGLTEHHIVLCGCNAARSTCVCRVLFAAKRERTVHYKLITRTGRSSVERVRLTRYCVLARPAWKIRQLSIRPLMDPKNAERLPPLLLLLLHILLT